MEFYYGLLICTVIIYIYMIQFHLGTYETVFNDDLVSSGRMKTGDLICFKAFDNFNSIVFGSYFGHIGVVYIDETDPTRTPMLFEANGVENMHLKPHHADSGIFLTPVSQRISKYKGRCFWKPLRHALSVEAIVDFGSFIKYCLDNMSYDTSVFKSSFKKFVGVEKCNLRTNCGEIVFLSLIKMGLIPYKLHDERALNFLKWMCNITELSDDYSYGELVHIIDHPFDK